MLGILFTLLFSLNPVYIEGWNYEHGSAAEVCQAPGRAIVACTDRRARVVTIDLEAVQVVAMVWALEDPGSPCVDWWYVYLDALRHENLHVLGYDHEVGGGFLSDQCRQAGVAVL